MASRSIRWGILGTGVIARTFAEALGQSRTGKLEAVGSRAPLAAGLGDVFPGARIMTYEALLADPAVDAVYVAAPHPLHVHWGIRAAEAGKHVLCEKPLGVDWPDAMALVAAVKKAGVLLAEAFMYRFHPQTRRLIDLLEGGAIGDIRLIKASFGFWAPFDPAAILFANELAGGSILDVGCYTVSMARLIAGVAAGKPFLDPDRVVGTAKLGATGIDEVAAAVLHFENGIIAEISSSISLVQDNAVRVFGTTGSLEVASPWDCTGHHGGTGTITIRRPDAAPEVVAIEEPGWLYAIEADAVGDAIIAGKTEVDFPGPSWADTLGNMKTLDLWRKSIGLEYGFEKRSRPTPRGGRHLEVAASPMRKVALAGIGKPVSLVGLGTAGLASISHMEVMLDAFYARGGNLIDTGYHYGPADRYLGHWLERSGVREEIVVLGKGAHSPLTYPDVIPRQLTKSLDALKTGYMDVYLMHRDNPDIPVGEFVDAIDEEVAAGRIHLYGFSNWTRERFDAALAHAQKNDRARPAALSNNFSLAEMVNPVWAGCVAASDDAWKAWLRRHRIPLFAWSSQARGFFTERAGRDRLGDQEMVHAWYSERNFQRRERAIELATRLGKKPIHVALAYCLHQDFAVLPIIGPLTLDELDDSLEALDISLTPADIAWLEG